MAQMPRALVALLALAGALGCAARATPVLPAGRLVDLSHAFDADAVFWPTEEGFMLERSSAGVTEGGYWYAANRFRSAEHGGTHVDAPIHFGEGGRSVDEIPLAQLVGPGVVVDVRGACARNRDYRVGVGDLEAWEAAHGRIPEGAIVLLRTGFGAFWPDRVRYMGTDRRGPEAVAELHFPGLHPDAARWLLERGVGAVGIDTPSIDHGPSTDFATHRVLAAAAVPVFENVAQLEALPETGFLVIALPMKIRGGTGGPLRIVALLP
jgi:kynurenine formamidase